jgi:malate synthase
VDVDGVPVQRILDDECRTIADTGGVDARRLAKARSLFAQVALGEDFPDFLTLPAYELID